MNEEITNSNEPDAMASNTATGQTNITSDLGSTAMGEDVFMIEAFSENIKSVWQGAVIEGDIQTSAIAFLIFIGFLFVRGLFSNIVQKRLHALTEKSQSDLDDKVIDALIPPIKFIPVIMGLYFAAKYAGIDNGGFNNFIQTLVTFTIFWGLSRSLEPIRHLSDKLEAMFTPTMVRWLFNVTKVVLIILATVIILEIWGINVGALLAGLGIFGAAVALGAQDVFKNLFAGITVITEKNFQPGDWIRIDGIVEGTVEDIGFRSTSVRRFDKALVQVPNALLSNAPIINFSRMSHRRIYWKIGVEYKTSVKQLETIRTEIVNYLENNDDFDKNVTTLVYTDSFGPSSIDIMIYCFTKTTVWAEWLDIKEKFAFALKEIVENKAKTAFAFPSQSIYIEQMPDQTPEPFEPPKPQKNKGKKAA